MLGWVWARQAPIAQGGHPLALFLGLAPEVLPGFVHRLQGAGHDRAREAGPRPGEGNCCSGHEEPIIRGSGRALGSEGRLNRVCTLVLSCTVCVCVCVRVFSSHSFWTSSSLDVPAGVTQEEGNTGLFIHLKDVYIYTVQARVTTMLCLRSNDGRAYGFGTLRWVEGRVYSAFRPPCHFCP